MLSIGGIGAAWTAEGFHFDGECMLLAASIYIIKKLDSLGQPLPLIQHLRLTFFQHDTDWCVQEREGERECVCDEQVISA